MTHMNLTNQFLRKKLEAVFKAKKRKAIGIDDTPTELLQNESAVAILWKLFSYCFDNAINYTKFIAFVKLFFQ